MYTFMNGIIWNVKKIKIRFNLNTTLTNISKFGIFFPSKVFFFFFLHPKFWSKDLEKFF